MWLHFTSEKKYRIERAKLLQLAVFLICGLQLTTKLDKLLVLLLELLLQLFVDQLERTAFNDQRLVLPPRLVELAGDGL